MNPKVLAFVDKLFFVPYRTLRFFFILSDKAKRPIESNQILVIKLMGLGSFTFFATLCEKYNVDKEKITLLTFASNQNLCSLLGFKNINAIRHENIFAFLTDCIIALRKTSQFKSISIIDYERCSYAVGVFRFMLAISSTSRIVCFENTKSNFIWNNLIAYSFSNLTIERMFVLGIEVMEKSKKTIKTETVVVKKDKILVNCNASNYMLGRRYPLEKFILAIENILRVHPHSEFIFTGATPETQYVEKFIWELKKKGIAATNMAGKWSIQDFYQELSTCHLLITCDSFPLHLAAYLGIPTLVIWGPTQPEQFGYENLTSLQSVSLGMQCAPCLLHLHSAPARACKGEITCMKNLDNGQIVSRALTILSISQEYRSVKILSQ